MSFTLRRVGFWIEPNDFYFEKKIVVFDFGHVKPENPKNHFHHFRDPILMDGIVTVRMRHLCASTLNENVSNDFACDDIDKRHRNCVGKMVFRVRRDNYDGRFAVHCQCRASHTHPTAASQDFIRTFQRD